MNKICTSIEQSQRLIELGIDVNTADMIYNVLGESYVRHNTPIDKYYTPAWSLSALLDLIPTSIDEYTDDFSQLELTKQSVSYVYAIGILRGTLRIGYLIKDNLLGAASEMVCWLKENNKL